MDKVGIKFLNLILSVSLVLCITGCHKEKQHSSVVESMSQKEETFEANSVEADLMESNISEAVSTSQSKDIISESDVQENLEDIVQNDFFSVFVDSITEEDENVIITLIFTNVSDFSYYKGDEEYHPGDSWEKIIRFTRDKWENYDNVYIHYKLCDSSIYEPNAQELFSGGVRYEMDEELNISNLEIFVDVPV